MLDILNNRYFTTMMLVFLIIFEGFNFSPKVKKSLKNYYFKVFVYSIIIFLAVNDLSLSLIALIVLVSLETTNIIPNKDVDVDVEHSTNQNVSEDDIANTFVYDEIDKLNLGDTNNTINVINQDIDITNNDVDITNNEINIEDHNTTNNEVNNTNLMNEENNEVNITEVNEENNEVNVTEVNEENNEVNVTEVNELNDTVNNTDNSINVHDHSYKSNNDHGNYLYGNEDVKYQNNKNNKSKSRSKSKTKPKSKSNKKNDIPAPLNKNDNVALFNSDNNDEDNSISMHAKTHLEDINDYENNNFYNDNDLENIDDNDHNYKICTDQNIAPHNEKSNYYSF